MEHCPDCQVPLPKSGICLECGLDTNKMIALSLAITSRFFDLLYLICSNPQLQTSKEINDAMVSIVKSREFGEGIALVYQYYPEPIDAFEQIIKRAR